MRNRSRLALLGAASAASVVGAGAGAARAEQLLTPQDFIIAIDAVPNFFIDDTGTGGTATMYPTPGEAPQLAVDGDLNTKFLNFGRRGGGFIVQTGGPSTVRSFQLFTGNDASERDMVSYVLQGTTSPVVSLDRSNGLGGETWTTISSGALSPPPAGTFMAPYAINNVTNNTAFTAYKMYFPDMRDTGGANSLQFSEVQFYDQSNATGTALLNPGSDIRAIDNPGSDSSYLLTERPQLAIDGLIATGSKYRNALNFSGGNDTHHGAGMIITPRRGQSVLQSFQIATANDVPARDPQTYEIYGTNNAIASADNSDGNAESWTLIGSGTINMPAERNTLGPEIALTNSTPYLSYKIVFPTTGNVAGGAAGGSGNSLQIGEILLNGILFGEPTWNVNSGGGSWFNGGNWVGPVPNGVGATARFLTGSTAPQTVYADQNVTVGQIVFNNPNTFVIAGAGQMTIDVATGNGSITVQQGTHKINLPLLLNDNTVANVSAGATLVIADPLDLNGRTLTKAGPGTMSIISTVAGGSLSIVRTTGGTTEAELDLGPVSVDAAGGNTNFRASQHLSSLSVGAGATATVANTANRNILRTSSLAIAGGQTPTGKLDLSDNAMVVDYTGASPLQDIRAQIRSGYNNGSWNGQGIVTSAGNASNFGLGYGEASAIGSPATFLGENIDNTTALVRFTRFGDANLDGQVNLQDFNRLAGAFGTTGTGLWTQGDFNYDGNVNLQDFNRLASNFGLSAAGPEVTPEDWARLTAAVPEPSLATAAATAALAAAAARPRRRRVKL